MSTIAASIPETARAADDFERQAHREVLESLYRQTPSSIVGHLIASAFVVYALSPVVALEKLVVWWLILLAVSVTRLLVNAACMQRWPVSDEALPLWSKCLGGLTLVQTLVWGLSAFMIWPDDIAHRAVLIVILAGVVAASGIVLAIHRNSYLVFCFPIVLPAIWQLFASGGRLEWVLGGLMILYSVILIIAVTRLGNRFTEGLMLRLQMQALSRTDSLTTLANRRGFDEYLTDSWQNAIRSSQSLGLIVADIDFFKGYNDEYGHPQGDEALKQLGEVLHRVAGRGTDLCARVGGEEFAIVLPSTDIEGTQRVAQAIQTELEETNIEHRRSPFGRLTISMGITALVPERTSSIEAFYEKADKALYRAKHDGRNRIEVVTQP